MEEQSHDNPSSILMKTRDGRSLLKTGAFDIITVKFDFSTLPQFRKRENRKGLKEEGKGTFSLILLKIDDAHLFKKLSRSKVGIFSCQNGKVQPWT